jgi:hypothetical protein
LRGRGRGRDLRARVKLYSRVSPVSRENRELTWRNWTSAAMRSNGPLGRRRGKKGGEVRNGRMQ